jgi:glycosyltransferase involved in cell wall biosynthesis
MAARVLWLTKGLGLGGAERLLALTAAGLDHDRFAVDVAYLLPWKDAFVSELEEAGVRTICLGALRTVDPRWVMRLRSLLRTEDYRILHTHSPVPASAARLLARRSHHVVHTEHNLWDRYRWPTYAANAATYRRNDAVLAVSDGVAGSIVRPRWQRSAGWPDVETLLHGVDVERVWRGPAARAAARKVLDLPPTQPVVGTVANFTPKKDHAGLLEALVTVREAVPDVLWLMIGSGPLEAELRGKATALGLDANVRFLGSRDDVLDLLPALDLFVLGSRFEGLPISLLEAMASEVPVVVTTVGGIPEAVTDGVEGTLVPPAAPQALALAVADLLQDPARRATLGTAAAARVRTDFSIARAVHRTEELYDQLLDGARPTT